MQAIAPARKNLLMRRLYWGMVIVWALVSLIIADRVSDHMKFRINDLAAVPGAGMVMRDAEGTFYHVNAAGKARAVYPELEGDYRRDCLDCVLVTGEQMSQTNDFCAAGIRTQLPKVVFEKPCASWAVISDGTKVVWVTLFLVPLLILPLIRAIGRSMSGMKPGSAK
jgi:hypothetical protein